MITKYYKVLTRLDDRLYSCINHITSIEYKLDKVITPTIKNSGLFIFNDLTRAYLFSGRNLDNFAIYEVECTNPRKITMVLDTWFMNDLDVDLFWRNYGNVTLCYNHFILSSPPAESYICDSLKLIREITLEDIKEHLCIATK